MSFRWRFPKPSTLPSPVSRWQSAIGTINNQYALKVEKILAGTQEMSELAIPRDFRLNKPNLSGQ